MGDRFTKRSLGGEIVVDMKGVKVAGHRGEHRNVGFGDRAPRARRSFANVQIIKGKSLHATNLPVR